MITFRVSASERLIRIEISGHIDYGTLAQFVQDLLSDATYDPNYDALIQVGEITGSVEAVRHLTVKLLSGLAERCGNAKWAFVAGRGLARSMIEMTFGGVDLGGVELRLFDKAGEARGWLGCSPHSD